MISISVVVGFQDAIRHKVSGFESQLTIGPLGRYVDGEGDVVEFLPTMQEAVSDAVPSGAVAMSVRQPVVLKTSGNFAGVVLYAYGNGHDSSFEEGNLIEGVLGSDPTDIVVSSVTAGKLSLSVGDKVDGCFFVDGALKLRRLTVSGIYSSNFSDYDRLTAYGDFGMLRKLRQMGEYEADAVEIRGLATDEIATAAGRLEEELSKRYRSGALTSGVNVTTVFDTGAMYFNWLGLLDTNVVVILVIMSLVSGFTLISCVFILILQRVGMIGVMKSLGATDRQIRTIFIMLGGRVVGLGLLAGDVIGLGLLLLQEYFHLVPLDPEAYFLAYVPVEINVWHILALNAGAVILGGLLMLLPASLVSRISPAKTMRYE
jgi:lipoprotein-releasing system permease protein